MATVAAPKAFAEGARCGTAGHVCLCERARDVVVRNVLPGPGRRMRAAGEIGELAGACGRTPRFGAALAAIGAKGESDAVRPRTRAGARGTGGAPLTPASIVRLALPSSVIAGLDTASRIYPTCGDQHSGTRASPSSDAIHRLRETLLRRGWTRGSSPRVTRVGTLRSLNLMCVRGAVQRATRCTADPGPRRAITVPGLRRIIPLRFMLRRARDTCAAATALRR